jgi:hypothetical protein
LIAEPLVVKRGGHADQLSRSTWGLDRFRARAIKKLLDSGIEGEKRRWTLAALAEKVAILAQGARKRAHEGEALEYDLLLTDFAGEIKNEQSANPSLLPAQGFSPKDSGAMAGVE